MTGFRLSRHPAAWALATALSAASVPPAAADETLADLIEQVSPAVVTILATQDRTPDAAPRGFDPDQFALPDLFRRFGVPQPDFDRFGKGGPRQGLGSGFVVDADGWIVTNHHVIDGADSVTVRLSDNREFAARVVGTDDLTDLALLRIDAGTALPAVELGDSDAIRVGEDVVAVGNPFGLGGTVTTGIVSAKGRNISGGPYAEFIQTDAAINKGNSGGPLFNMAGEVIGVNSAIYSPTGGSVGLGFAVSSNIVGDIVEDLRDDGKVDRGWLGVSIQAVNGDIAAAMGLDSATGALVTDVVDGAPADGVLRTGDVILDFDGTRVDTSADLPRIVGMTDSGSRVDIRILRGGSEQTVTLVVGAHESASADITPAVGSGDPADLLGVTVARLTEHARAEAGIGDDVNGVIVTSIADTGPAARAGLRVGDVILRVGDTDTDTPRALRDALQSDPDGPALLLIDRGGNRVFVAVRLA